MSTKEIDLSKLAENKIIQFILNILFGMSTVCLTFLLMEYKFAVGLYMRCGIYYHRNHSL